ncbi:dihydrolipoamide acetyltransferase family protein [Geopsychrobacter electrodiphilus]|uniref:dihydrolipoamide acetyltransferase family protein n=1 Tax=Geopsychrobacter electrodiphilus TaxID=225196 RepID=UPI00037EEDB9|nr:dihydrolipoamide acetyltransferase family protein [Geopsychrobacter electrodiphilus]
MVFEFRLPDLGEGIAEAEIRGWLVAEGAQIEEHQPVVEVETDKALVELPSPRAGQVVRCHQPKGAIVKVGEVLLTLEEPVSSAERPPSYGIVGQLPEAEDERPMTRAPSKAATTASFLAMPAVRKLARDLEVDLKGLSGTGPEGSITAADVRAAQGGPAAFAVRTSADEQGERQAQTGLRRTIARRLLQSQQTMAFVTNMDEFDVSRLWELKQRERPHLFAQDLHLTFLPFFMKAVQHALLEFPRFNARLDEARDELVLLPDCHLGIAVDTAEGLLVPVVRDVGRKSIVKLAAELQGLSERAHQRSIALHDLQGSTFTLTNFGAYGGYFATPIINPPNVAILGCGRISQRPWVVEGALAARYVLPLSLTFDHRITDGAEACRFLSRIGQYLEDPALLFIESV